MEYENNRLCFSESTGQDLHLVGLTGLVVITNRRNWTNYLPYNAQTEQLNANRRLQGGLVYTEH